MNTSSNFDYLNLLTCRSELSSFVLKDIPLMSIIQNINKNKFVHMSVELSNNKYIYVHFENEGLMVDKIFVPDAIIHKLQITRSRLHVIITDMEEDRVLQNEVWGEINN